MALLQSVWSRSISTNGGYAMNASHDIDDIPAHRV
jgi:hypothetical protein